MLSHYVKVSIKGKKPIYLENAKYVKDQTFIAGYQIDKNGDGIANKFGGDILHLIQLGDGVKITNMETDKMYGDLKPVPDIAISNVEGL
jgi:hypothetical protein